MRGVLVKAILALVALSGLVRTASGQPWHRRDWSHRRVVDVVEPQRLRFPGEDLAVVEFRTAGQVLPDGRDIHVTTATGAAVPSRVLQVGPGDTARVVFALAAGTRYIIYYGNEDADPPERTDIRRGVLLETWAYPGGPMDTLEQVREIFDNVDEVIGRGFRDNIFLGHNPFGPQNRLASRFTGYLLVPRTATYTFAVSSNDASFLLIDGELVIDNGGRRRPQRRAENTAEVRLTAGAHEVVFYHVCAGGAPVAALAWKSPESGDFEPVPAEAFLPVSQVRVGPMETQGRGWNVDFEAVHAGETWMKDRYYQRYKFSARHSVRRPRQWQWSFGDGQEATGDEVEHVYLRDGEYTVTVTGQIGNDQFSRSHRIVVSRPWDRVTARRLDSVSDYAAIVAEYYFDALEPPPLAEAILLLHEADRTAELIRAGASLVARERAPAEVLSSAAVIYADVLLEQGLAAAAAEALARAEAMTDDPRTSAALLVRAGRTALDEARDTDKAMRCFSRVVGELALLTSSPDIRLARIGLGDVHRALGDAEKAAEAYARAGQGRSIPAERLPFVKGNYARHVEAYIRSEDYDAAADYLRRWSETFPSDKLEGYWSLLKVRYHLELDEPAAAAVEATTLVNANPDSNYAAELLMLAAEAYGRQNKPAERDAAWRRVVEHYPESELAIEAADKLGM